MIIGIIINIFIQLKSSICVGDARMKFTNSPILDFINLIFLMDNKDFKVCKSKSKRFVVDEAFSSDKIICS